MATLVREKSYVCVGANPSGEKKVNDDISKADEELNKLQKDVQSCKNKYCESLQSTFYFKVDNLEQQLKEVQEKLNSPLEFTTIQTKQQEVLEEYKVRYCLYHKTIGTKSESCH